jgi:hypothetical protein
MIARNKLKDKIKNKKNRLKKIKNWAKNLRLKNKIKINLIKRIKRQKMIMKINLPKYQTKNQLKKIKKKKN